MEIGLPQVDSGKLTWKFLRQGTIFYWDFDIILFTIFSGNQLSPLFLIIGNAFTRLDLLIYYLFI